jgi:hypothetical protein
MATEKSKASDDNGFGLLGLMAFAAVVALFLFVSTTAGTRGMGVLMLLAALLQQVRGRIAYGWEGRPPSGYFTGPLATGLNLLFAAIGVAMLIWPEVVVGIFGWGDR